MVKYKFVNYLIIMTNEPHFCGLLLVVLIGTASCCDSDVKLLAPLGNEKTHCIIYIHTVLFFKKPESWKMRNFEIVVVIAML